MIFLAGLGGILVGLISGGRFKSIRHKKFRLWPLLICAALFDFILASGWFSDLVGRSRQAVSIRISLLIVQYILISIFLYKNRLKPGLNLILAGGWLNAFVQIANSGRMPIGQAVLNFGPKAAEKIQSAPHYFLATGDEPLLFLADILPLWIYMLSVGDIIIAVGLFLLGFYLPRVITRQG